MAATVESLTVAINDQASAPADQMAAAMEGAAAAADQLAGSVQTTDEKITRSTRSWQSWAAAGVDPAATSAKRAEANQRAAAAATDALTAALTQGKISASQFAQGQQDIAAALAQRNAAVQTAQERTEKLRGSTNQLTTSQSAGRQVLRDLALQSQDLFSQIASGGNVMTAFIQQGSQVSQQMMASGQGFSALGSAAKIALGAITSPMGLLVTGATVATGAVIALGVAAESQSVRLGNLRQQLRATHDDYATLAESAEAAAKRVAATSTLSTSDARAGAQTIASAKYFVGTTDDIVKLTKASGDLARVWNVDVATAAGRLRDSINDPAAAAAKFASEGLPAFNQGLVLNVQMLERAGKAGQAQKAVVDALGQSSAGAVKDQSQLSTALHDLEQRFTAARNGGKSFATTIGESIDGAAAAMVRLVDGVVQGLNRINSASNVADQNARDLAAGRAGAAAAAASSAGGLAAQTGREVLLGPVIPGSSERAMGIMQLLPSTARGMGYNPAIPDENIAGGLTYLQQQTGQYGVEGGLARYGGYGSNVGGAAGYISKVQGQDVSKLPTDVSSSIEYWGQVLGLSDSQITLGKKMALQESGGRQYASSGASFALPAIDVTDVADRKDHQGATSAANRALLTDQRRLSDNLGNDTSGTRALGSLGSAADLVRVHDEMAIVNRQLAEMALHGDITSTAFKQAAAQAAGLTQKEQELLAADRNRLDPQAQFLRGMQDQVAANAGLTEGDQRVLQLRQQMAQVERDQGGSFSPEQRAQAEAALSKVQQQALDRQIDGMRTATAGQDNLAAAYGQGYDAVAKSTAATAAYTASLAYGAKGSDQQRAAAASLTAEYERQAASASKLAIQQATRQNTDQLTYLDAETQSLGMNDNARTALLAHKQAEILLGSKNIAVTSAEGAAYLDSVDKISARTAALKSQEASLNELTSFVDNTFSTVSDAIVSAFATGEQSAVKFKDVAASVVKAVEAEFLKLALINPLKDLLLGSTSPNLFSVGGVLGKLLGNAGSSSNDAGTSVFDGAGVNFGDQIGSSTSSTGSSGLGLSDVAGAAGTLGTLGKAADYLTGGHLVSDLSSGIKDTFNQISNTSLYSSAPTAGGLTVPAGAADDVATATGSVANPTGSLNGVNINVGSAVGIVGGLYSAYSGFERGGVGGTVQGIGGIASAGFAAAGAGLLGSGAAGLAAAAGPYAPIALAAIAIIGALLPGAHPIHPFQDTEVDATGGHLTVGKTVSQVETTTAAVQAVNDYSASLDQFMSRAGLKLTNLDGVIGHVGENITGLVQVSSPDALFNKLSFGNDPSDTSNFGVAKGALQGMSFNTFQDLGAELQKIAAFSDAASVIGLKLQSVSTDISNIQIASVDQNAAAAKTTVKDAQGGDVTYDSDLRRALQSDLPGKTFANVQALDDEIASVSAFITQSLPQLLTPTKVTQSSVQDSIQASNQRYADAIGRDQSLGLGNTDVLTTARDQAIAILMKPALDSLNTTLTSITGRGSALLYGQGGSAAATMANLAQTQNNERSSLYDTIHQTFGDNQVATDNYNRALQALITTQNAETEATRQQLQLAQDQGLASLKASEADIAKRAGIDSLSQQLAAYDTKAQVETDTFIASWRAYYGQYAAVGEDFQNQMSALWLAHNNERLQIEQDYNAQSSTQASAAMKQAQGSVASLFSSIKDYAVKLQTGSSSPLSPLSQYDLAKSQFNAVSGAALAGDANSASQVTSYADAFLAASQSVNDHGAAYAADFSSVIDVLQGIGNSADALTQSFMAQQLQTQTDQVVSTLQSTSADLKAEISALRREVQIGTAQRAAA